MIKVIFIVVAAKSGWFYNGSITFIDNTLGWQLNCHLNDLLNYHLNIPQLLTL